MSCGALAQIATPDAVVACQQQYATQCSNITSFCNAMYTLVYIEQCNSNACYTLGSYCTSNFTSSFMCAEYLCEQILFSAFDCDQAVPYGGCNDNITPQNNPPSSSMLTPAPSNIGNALNSFVNDTNAIIGAHTHQSNPESTGRVGTANCCTSLQGLQSAINPSATANCVKCGNNPPPPPPSPPPCCGSASAAPTPYTCESFGDCVESVGSAIATGIDFFF